MGHEIALIEALGPGCPRCKETYRVVRGVVESAGLACRVVKNESLGGTAEVGVMATPAVVIDGGVVLSGRIPTADEVRELLGVA